jgi:LysR family transcriptional regulator, transcriptional activator of nhaA
MIPLNYHHLYYFYVIAKSETIAKACEELYLAQSTLSAQLSLFEKTIGRKLFNRHKQRLVLTEDGRLVLDYAETIFEVGKELQDVLRDNRLPERLAIQLGVLNGTPRAFCHSLTEAIYKFMPKAYISLQEGTSDDLLRQLQEHNLDLVLTDVFMHGPQPDELANHLVAKVPIIFATAKRMASKYKRIPADLNNAPFILPSHPSQVHRQVLDLFAEWKIKPQIMAEIQDIEVARRMALSGRGIAPLNAYTVSVSLPKGELVSIIDPKMIGIHESVYLVTRKRKRLNPLAEYLLKAFSLNQP